MSILERKLDEDRAMRDAARRLFEADLDLVKGDTQSRSLTRRAADGVSETSLTLADEVVDFARAHPLAIGGGVLAILLFLFRGTIIDLLADLFDGDEDADTDEPRMGSPNA